MIQIMAPYLPNVTVLPDTQDVPHNAVGSYLGLHLMRSWYEFWLEVWALASKASQTRDVRPSTLQRGERPKAQARCQWR